MCTTVILNQRVFPPCHVNDNVKSVTLMHRLLHCFYRRVYLCWALSFSLFLVQLGGSCPTRVTCTENRNEERDQRDPTPFVLRQKWSFNGVLSFEALVYK